MPVIDVSYKYRTIGCDSCKNTVTFDQAENEKNPKATIDANPWLMTTRVVQTNHGRTYAYCSSACEVSGVTAGNHEPPEEKKIIDISTAGPGINMSVKLAAEAAAKAKQATDALKAGEPVTL